MSSVQLISQYLCWYGGNNSTHGILGNLYMCYSVIKYLEMDMLPKTK